MKWFAGLRRWFNDLFACFLPVAALPNEFVISGLSRLSGAPSSSLSVELLGQFNPELRAKFEESASLTVDADSLILISLRESIGIQRNPLAFQCLIKWLAASGIHQGYLIDPDTFCRFAISGDKVHYSVASRR